MEKLLELAVEIRWLSETSSPTIHDLACDMVEYIKKNPMFTQDEIMQMLNRRDNIDIES